MSFLFDNYVYQEAIEIKLGKKEKSQLLEELSSWFLGKYEVPIANFQYSKFEIPNTQTYRLYLILENSTHHRQLCRLLFSKNDEQSFEFEHKIISEFRRLAIKHQITSRGELKDIAVRFGDLEYKSKERVNKKAVEEAQRTITPKYADIWQFFHMFDHAVVFYYSDQDIVKNKKSGLSDEIENDYFNILKRYDELGYFSVEATGLTYDSKENVDKNYQRSLIYYSKQ